MVYMFGIFKLMVKWYSSKLLTNFMNESMRAQLNLRKENLAFIILLFSLSISISIRKIYNFLSSLKFPEQMASIESTILFYDLNSWYPFFLLHFQSYSKLVWKIHRLQKRFKIFSFSHNLKWKIYWHLLDTKIDLFILKLKVTAVEP